MDNQLLPIGKTAKLLGISIKTLQRWDKSGKFVSIRVGSKGNRFYKKSDIELLLKDLTALALKWASDQNGLRPDPAYFCETRDVFQARLEHFQSELLKTLSVEFTSLVAAISGEIGNNSFDHNLGNWPDIQGVYFSYSLSQKKVVMADRGQGILATLKKVLPNLDNALDALEVAFTKTISGRSPENRGNGLKFVKDVILSNPIGLIFYTGDAVLLKQKDKNFYNITHSDEAHRSYDRGVFSPLLRRERNPSEADISSHSSVSLHSRYSAKGDKLVQGCLAIIEY